MNGKWIVVVCFWYLARTLSSTVRMRWQKTLSFNLYPCDHRPKTFFFLPVQKREIKKLPPNIFVHLVVSPRSCFTYHSSHLPSHSHGLFCWSDIFSFLAQYSWIAQPTNFIMQLLQTQAWHFATRKKRRSKLNYCAHIFISHGHLGTRYTTTSIIRGQPVKKLALSKVSSDKVTVLQRGGWSRSFSFAF